MSVAEVDALTEGSVFTVTLTVAVFEHPLASVPVTVYVSVTVGVNATLSVTLPLQVYTSAPLPESVIASPSHTALAVVFAVTEGSAFTVTLTVAVFEHPFASVPVTV